MNLHKSLLLITTIVFVGCSNPNGPKSQESIQLKPSNDTLGLSFGIKCDKETHISTFGIKGPLKLDRNFTFTTDQAENSYIANVADDLVNFSPEDSRSILKDMEKSKFLKVKTSSITADFDLVDANKNIHTYIRECL